jgi:hypothetical protein
MEKCRRRIITKDKRRKASWDFESSGLVLRIGHRTSSKYYRVYQTDQEYSLRLQVKSMLLTVLIFILRALYRDTTFRENQVENRPTNYLIVYKSIIDRSVKLV